jgi:predicted DNA-binding transcriptional regulator AlpA
MGKKLDLVGLAEVAKMAGISKARLCNWRSRNVKNVPKPIVELAQGPVWDKTVIEKWLKECIIS